MRKPIAGPQPIHGLKNLHDFTVPREALSFILLQKPSSRRHRKHLKHLPASLHSFLIRHETLLCGRSIRDFFLKTIHAEFDEIRPGLPPQATHILDIGCGVAGIDVLLFRHYGGDPNLIFYLLDRTEISKEIYYGFRETAAFYCSLEIARKMLTANGVSEDHLRPLSATDGGLIETANESLDLILSLSSWGFHYPASVYLNQVHQKLKAGGTLILDIRKDTGGEEILSRKFRTLRALAESDKKIRYALLK